MPESSTVTVPLFKVLVDGADIKREEADRVLEIRISDFLRLPDVCSVAIGYLEPEQLDATGFKIGAQLEVRMGSTDQQTTQRLFIGEIVTLEPNFGNGAPTMVVRAYDRAHRMMRVRKRKAYTKRTIGDIVRQLCGNNGLSPKITGSTPGGQLDYVIQHNETDWDFMWRLLDRIGWEADVQDKDLDVSQPGHGAEEVELEYKKGLITFEPRVTAVQQVSKVNVHGFDHKAKDTAVGTSGSANQIAKNGIERDSFESAFGSAELHVVGQSFRSMEEANAIAQAQYDQISNGYVAAVGTTKGDPRIKAGVKLKITGVGTKFSGTYRAARVEHVIKSGGAYTTKFYNSPGGHTLVAQASSNGAGTLDSLIVGIVTNNQDPDKMGRVKVKVPVLDNEESFWAPVAVPAAGPERGLSMLPVAGEQVIIGFENGDPSHPYVLGSVFNGTDKPGQELAVEDGSYAMKSDKKALFAAKEDITLRSDGGKWIIEIKGGEIKETVNSGQGGQGGYTGQFDGAYKVKATQGVTIESSMKVEIKAPQIDITADAQLSLKGKMVQISGDASVQVSGGMISLG
jgi:uncharacterized protein involved in type VI secretion and phage assembly